ncbi:hypothetical protein CJI50_03755, partial [Bifidobacteriaceae bacterium NR021]
MLNKKAIAAFAAGATLLSGFAFAAPAMADCPAPAPYHNDAKRVADAAYNAYHDAQVVLDGMTVSPKPAEPLAVIRVYINTTPDPATGLIALAHGAESAPHSVYVKAKAYVEAYNANVTSQKAYNDQNTKVENLKAEWIKAKDILEHCAKPDPTEHDIKMGLINEVRLAKMNLDNADNEFAIAKKNLMDAHKAAVAAQAEYNKRKADFDAAERAYQLFLASGVNDSATQTRLYDTMKRAGAHVTRTLAAWVTAKNNYDDALKKALKAEAIYNKALALYKAAYNKAVAGGVDPSLLPHVVTSDPLDPKLKSIPGMNEAYASAMNSKFGKEVKANTQKGKDTKASAQQNNNANGAAAGA